MNEWLILASGVAIGAGGMFVLVDFVRVKPLQRQLDLAFKGWNDAFSMWRKEIARRNPVKSPFV